MNLSQFLSLDKLLKNVSLLRMCDNLTVLLYNDTAKRDFFYEKKVQEHLKITKRSHTYKCYVGTYNIDILNS